MLNFVLTLILTATALCIDSLVVSVAVGCANKLSRRRKLFIALVFAVFQALFPLLGALLGASFKGVAEAIDHWIAFALLLIVGLNMFRSAFADKGDTIVADVSKFSTICSLGIATSIDAFVVGIGIGLDSTWSNTFVQIIVIGIETFLFSMLGLMLGSKQKLFPRRASTAIAGAVLMAMAVKVLFDHGVLG